MLILSIITISQNCLTNNKIRAKNFENKPWALENKQDKGVCSGEQRERCSRPWNLWKWRLNQVFAPGGRGKNKNLSKRWQNKLNPWWNGIIVAASDKICYGGTEKCRNYVNSEALVWNGRSSVWGWLRPLVRAIGSTRPNGSSWPGGRLRKIPKIWLKSLSEWMNIRRRA